MHIRVEDKLCNAADSDVNVGVDEFLDPLENVMTFFEDDSSDCIEVYMPDSEQKYTFRKLPHKVRIHTTSSMIFIIWILLFC